MKNYIIPQLFILLTLFSGCESFVDGWDESPNSATEATPALLLTNSQVATFSVYTGQNARTAAILMQQCTGVSDQMYDVVQNYNISEGDVENEWQSIYESGLQTPHTLINDYSEGYPYYQGMAKVLMAMNLGLATDLWGDIPFTEALQGLEGEEYYYPHFESQEAIFSHVQTLLDEGIAFLSEPVSANLILPGADDIIFNGNAEAWIAAAWVLKARYAIRLTKKSEAEAIDDAILYLSKAYEAGMINPEANLNAYFDGSGNAQSQWWDFENERGGYMRMNEFFVTLLKDKSDPRLPYYVSEDGDGEYLGAPMGETSSTGYSYVGPVYNSPDATLPLITFSEAKFIEAEAQFRKGNTDAAADAYNAAVIASVERITGEDIPEDYLAAEASETDASVSLEKIMTQKYIALFTQPEVWADWRRTDIPSLSPYAEATGVNNIPRRFPLALSERTNNPFSPDPVSIVVPVWWDE